MQLLLIPTKLALLSLLSKWKTVAQEVVEQKNKNLMSQVELTKYTYLPLSTMYLLPKADKA